MEATEERVAAIKARAEAATPGPWHWAGNTDSKNIYLATWLKGVGRCTVLDFTRWGMQSARPRFGEDLMMVNADTIVTYEVAPGATRREDPRVYRADIEAIRHPDAELIAGSKSDIEFLLADRERLETEIVTLRQQRHDNLEAIAARDAVILEATNALEGSSGQAALRILTTAPADTLTRCPTERTHR